MANKYTNTASKAALVDAISSSATEVELSGFAGWPSATPYWAEIARGTSSAEVVLVTDVSGNLVTISRGQDGTTASSHNAGDSFEHVMPAYLPNLAEQHAESTTAHGASSPLVGRDDTVTLANKTYRGAHTHSYSDTQPGSPGAGFEVNADTAVARDGFVFHNIAADPDRAAIRTTQSGADRVVAYADGTVKITPSGSATRPALDVAGLASAASAAVAGGVSVGGDVTVAGDVSAAHLDLPTPAAGDTSPRVVVRTQAGQPAVRVLDQAGATRIEINADGQIRSALPAGGRAVWIELDDLNAALDGTVLVWRDGTSEITQLWPDRVEITDGTGVKHSIVAGPAGMLRVVTSNRVMVDRGLVTENPAAAGVPESWHALTLAGGWTHRAEQHAPAVRLSVDEGIVRLRGGLTGGDTTQATTVCTLAAPYRPSKSVLMPVACSTPKAGGVPRVFVRTTGAMEIYGVDGDFSLDGLSYGL